MCLILLSISFTSSAHSEIFSSSSNAYYLIMDNVTGHSGDDIVLKAQLYSSNASVVNKRVCFHYKDGSNTYQEVDALTNGNGVAMVRVSPVRKSGKYILYSRCEECNSYARSYLDVLVSPGTYYLTMDEVKGARATQDMVLKAQLHSLDSNESVFNKTIVFYIYDPLYKEDYLAEGVVTDKDGNATLDCRAPNSSGEFIYGSSFYEGYASFFDTFNVI